MQTPTNRQPEACQVSHFGRVAALGCPMSRFRGLDRPASRHECLGERWVGKMGTPAEPVTSHIPHSVDQPRGPYQLESRRTSQRHHTSSWGAPSSARSSGSEWAAAACVGVVVGRCACASSRAFSTSSLTQTQPPKVSTVTKAPRLLLRWVVLDHHADELRVSGVIRVIALLRQARGFDLLWMVCMKASSAGLTYW